MRHEYLSALELSGSAEAGTGWAPRPLTIEADGRLLAACALYLKSHSYGEYVFDWAWADAYRRHGLRYYPKGLVASPFTPVQGSRLLARDPAARSALAQALRRVAALAGLSSLHMLFGDDADVSALHADGWALRSGVQFHWSQDEDRPVVDWSDLLQRMQRDKRKKIQQERRRVAEAGIEFQALEGRAIGEADWDFFHRCYTATYHAHGSDPYLTRDFFRRVAEDLSPHWLLFVARRGGVRVACSLIAIDRARAWAWGRYWGALEYVPCLHFEACYYQPLQWCLAEGIRRFEGGAQGEHKMARGLMPVTMRSAHWIADARFREAIEDAVDRETAGLVEYVDELRERSPFRSGPGTGAG